MSVLLLLLALGTVMTAQLYWRDLRGGVEQMRASVAAAQQEQQRLMARVRAAEAVLAEREAAPVSVPAEAETAHESKQPAGKAASGHLAPRGESGLRQGLTGAERAALAARLEALGRDAARLPPAPEPARRRAISAANKQLLRDQLAVAAVAAAADDIPLLDAALFGAQRLSGPPYRGAGPRGRDLAAAISVLREGLRAPVPLPAPPATQAPTPPLSAPLR
jgi:hypothetical protein